MVVAAQLIMTPLAIMRLAVVGVIQFAFLTETVVRTLAMNVDFVAVGQRPCLPLTPLRLPLPQRHQRRLPRRRRRRPRQQLPRRVLQSSCVLLAFLMWVVIRTPTLILRGNYM